MSVSKFAAITATLALLFTTSVSAQSLAGNAFPAEFPPSSFKGNQYVDSKGCVFIRAGISGNTTWVPRVSRNRQILCGFQPSLKGATAAAPAQAVPTKSAPQPVRKPAPKPKAVAKTQTPVTPTTRAAAPVTGQTAGATLTPQTPRRDRQGAKSTPASHRFVQVGTYEVKGNASRAAQRLAAVGLPAKIGRATRSGKTYQVVLVGPFQDQPALRAALQGARSAGFRDAFLRK